MTIEKKHMNLKHTSQYTLTVANLVLMAFLLLAIFVVMTIPSQFQKTLYQFCFGGILISAFFCIDKKYRLYMRWLVILDLLLQWTYLITANFVLNWVSKSLTICLYIVIAIWLVKQAASSKTVTRIVILESVNGYLMIGMFYSIIIALVMLLNPEAYNFHILLKNSSENEILTNFNEYLYYGFNAFTTVTYGDVMPVSAVAKSVSMAMGFTGQMYVAVIIAMLVGKYAGASGKKE
jgi:voltage-gated potassium channel